MLSKVMSFGLSGITGYRVEVEIDINNGLPSIEMVGLPDAAIRESKERVRSAVKNSGYKFSPQKITINFAPADTKKEGALYDLPIALGILAATEQIPCQSLSDTAFIGELSLDGQVQPARGILPIVLSAKECGLTRLVVPQANESEACFVEGLEVLCVGSLREAAEHLAGIAPLTPVRPGDAAAMISMRRYEEDFKYVRGQYAAKRALEIAAAGGHNILMIGPPGAGKTMLAKCVPTILPDITPDEALETTKIHSVAGVLSRNDGLVVNRPFRSPHHTATRIALTGGGNSLRPGEISLAHNGVLFLDELPEYPRSTLEVLRQPLEDNVITVSRAAGSVVYPADFMLVASMNPCPCGHYGTDKECSCTPAQIQKYRARISGPLLDRIDLHIEVDSVTYDDLRADESAEPSEAIKARVDKAREIQLRRLSGTGIYCNARLTSRMVKEYCALDEASEAILRAAFERLGLSARAYTRILKVARTIADLAGEENISKRHVAEAVNYRSLDRRE